MKKRYFVYGVLSGLLVAGVLSSTHNVLDDMGRSKAETSNIGYAYASDIADVLSFQNVFVRVAKTVKPTVVQVTTEKVVQYRRWDPFRDFEGLMPFGMPQRRESDTYERRIPGLGSGFIVDPQGYIITNNHVIEGVDKIIVTLHEEEREYEAEVIGTDPKTDLALIKIDVGRPLPAVVLGDSDNLQVAEWVMAVGNPMGLSATVTVGIVSATGRSGFRITHYEDFIQTDAAINRGNSGGPLVNIRGEVVGINTFIVSPQIADNLGFAIPVNIAKNVFSQLKEKGKVTRGYLGVNLQVMDAALADSFGLKESKGVLVSEVFPGTPAERGGIQEGDIIIEFDGVQIKDIPELQMKVADTPVDAKVTVVVWREMKEVRLEFSVGEMPDEETAMQPQDDVWRGMKVSNITTEIKESLQLQESDGVVVVDVEPGSPAHESGVVPSVIIVRVNNQKVSNMSDFREAVKGVPGDRDVRLRVIHRGQGRFMVLKGERR